MNFAVCLYSLSLSIFVGAFAIVTLGNLMGQRKKKEKVVVIMGPTASGKTRLSVDLATRFPAEIINSDKMQFHEGLDVITNKASKEERRGVPHHLFGFLPPDADFSAEDFRRSALSAINSIHKRNLLPIIVGGSNSYLEALIDDEDNIFRSKYECCFLQMDVCTEVHYDYIRKRVDKMIENGMVEEAVGIFNPRADYSKGVRKSIGVPEFDKFIRNRSSLDANARGAVLKEAIDEVKENTCKLASNQLEKISRLRSDKGWEIKRLDATEVFLKQGKEADETWEKKVAGPAIAIVHQFLNKGNGGIHAASAYTTATTY